MCRWGLIIWQCGCSRKFFIGTCGLVNVLIQQYLDAGIPPTWALRCPFEVVGLEGVQYHSLGCDFCLPMTEYTTWTCTDWQRFN